MKPRYSQLDKEVMISFYNNGKSIREIAYHFKCAYSTVFYAIHPEAYEKHKSHVYYMEKLKRGVK